MEVGKTVCFFLASLLVTCMLQHKAFNDSLYFVSIQPVISPQLQGQNRSYQVEITKQITYPLMSSLLFRITIPQWFVPDLVPALGEFYPEFLRPVSFAVINSTIAILAAALLTAR